MNGDRRLGKPRTNAQRKARHRRLYGTSKLPARGSGLRRGRKLSDIIYK